MKQLPEVPRQMFFKGLAKQLFIKKDAIACGQFTKSPTKGNLEYINGTNTRKLEELSNFK